MVPILNGGGIMSTREFRGVSVLLMVAVALLATLGACAQGAAAPTRHADRGHGEGRRRVYGEG